MNLGLRGKVAMVAGGSSGLGFAVAEELAREGAEVCIAARDPARLRVAEETLRRVEGGRVHARVVDVRRSEEVDAWIEQVTNDRGAPHIVVTNSAGPPAGPATRFSTSDYREAVETVMLPAIHLALATLPGMKEKRWGRLLFITSETVHRPAARYALSGVARMGIVGFAQALVQELGDAGITVNVLAPGYHRTAPVVAAAGADVESGLRAMAQHIPLRRVGEPRELAAVAAFLASERASFVTGTVQLVDGGASVAV